MNCRKEEQQNSSTPVLPLMQDSTQRIYRARGFSMATWKRVGRCGSTARQAPVSKGFGPIQIREDKERMWIGIEAGCRGGFLVPLWNDGEHLNARLTTTTASGGGGLLQRSACVRED